MSERAAELTLAELSPLSEAVRRAFDFVRWLSPMHWLQKQVPSLKPRASISLDEIWSADFMKRRGRAVEIYVLVWILIEMVAVVLATFAAPPNAIKIAIFGLVTLRIIEILQVTVNATVFDRLSGRADNCVSSSTRLLVLAGLNFLELAACFGVIYADCYTYLGGAVIGPSTALYFSVITQLTIGYGDVYPTGGLRVVAAIHGVAALLFLALVVTRVVATLPRIRAVLEDGEAKRVAELGDAAGGPPARG
ncbi:MAG: potassium channel family protein [Candidatus Eisenbacteria bacterium]